MSPVVAVARDLGVQYGSHNALDGVSFEFREGERVALVGQSGAGKSTLLRCLSGLTLASNGQLQVLGVNPKTATARQLCDMRMNIGVVQQGLDLAGNLKVIHNVNAAKVGQWGALRSTWSLLRAHQPQAARDALETLDMGWALNQLTDSLSGGERQRVAVARVILKRPKLVLADEPVSSLDPELAEKTISGMLAAIPDNGLAVVSLHQPTLAQKFFDRIIGLKGGRVVFDANATQATAELLSGVYVDREQP